MTSRPSRRARKAPQSSPSERRRYPRRPGSGLMALIAGKLVEVLEVSATGILVRSGFEAGDDPIDFALYPCSGGRLNLNAGIRATGIVVHREEGRVGLRFQPASMKLVRFVATHTG
jgi:hypothetical protein